MSSQILGISAYYHDSAACLVRDGRLIAAAQEERFSRRKHDARFPREAIEWCLREGGLAGAGELDAVVFYDKPIRKFDRLLESYLHYAPRGIESFLRAMPDWLRSKLKMKEMLGRELQYEGRILFAEHHESHAASAFYPSPFSEAAILTVDGVGEWCTAALGRGEGRTLELQQELRFPHSLGLLYSAFTAFAGFEVNSGEYKLMGLAPYGRPRYVDRILEELVDLRPDGSLRLNMRYFDYCTRLRMTNERFARLFDGPARAPEGPFTERDLDLAASVQRVVEETVLRMARRAAEITGSAHLVLAGGVALNCVANGRLLREGSFEKIWVQPAAGDAGGALGAALFAHHQLFGGERILEPGRDRQEGSLLGPSFDDEELADWIEERQIVAERARDRAALCDRVAELLAAGKVVGWFQGRMEFGPRALGNRSILADPRDPQMQKKLNLRIKFRESFRPFGPAVLREHLEGTFELDAESPYMLLVAPLHRNRRLPPDPDTTGLEMQQVPRSDLPAITHVDASARIQSVDRERNPLFHELLESFHRRTGCPVLVNTSFNVRGEPIVCTPDDAFRCFQRTGLDAIAIGSFLIASREGSTPSGREAGPGPEESRRSEARRFALILAIVLTVLALATLAFGAHGRRAAYLAAGAVSFATLSWWAPPAWILAYGLWAKLAKALARGVSLGVLAAFFYLALTPLGLLLRLLGRPRLDTTWGQDRVSYWKPRSPAGSSIERYEKAF